MIMEKRKAYLILSLAMSLLFLFIMMLGLHNMDNGYNLTRLNGCSPPGVEFSESNLFMVGVTGEQTYILGFTFVLVSVPLLIGSMVFTGVLIGGLKDGE